MSDSSPLPTSTPLHRHGYPKVVWEHRRCETCEHYDPIAGGDGSVGYCCCNPPTPMAAMGANPQALVNPNAPAMVAQLQGVFPPTRKTNRCGKWEMKVKGSA